MVRSRKVIVAPPMPYPEDALEPLLSAKTVHFHRLKQERYVRRTNELVRGTSLEEASLPEVVEVAGRMAAQDDDELVQTLFEQSSQALNHAQMWASMRPPTMDRGRAVGRRPPPAASRLEAEWRDEAARVFGSGWVWLVLGRDGRLTVEGTQDADRPCLGDPLLVMDVWEHAYYLDYPDARAEYVEAWWHALADWSVLEERQ